MIPAMVRLLVAVAMVLGGCEGGRGDGIELVPIGPDEPSGGVRVEPVPDLPEEVPQPPTTEPIPPADEATGEPAAAADPPALRVIDASCGENARGGTASLRARVRRNGTTLRITLRDLSYYCQPAPRFDASIADEGLVVHVLRPLPGVAVARCVCYYDAILAVSNVPGSVDAVRFVDADGAEIGSARLGDGL